ncbi:MAG: TetR/AcrR family transcriptional regulator [Bacteroidota bacterium]
MSEKQSIAQKKKLREKEFRKLMILDSAETILHREGLNGLSMSLVAKEAEVAKGTLYLYFKNKEEILSHLALKARGMLLAEFHKRTQKHKNPLKKIEGIIWSNYYMYKEQKLYHDLMNVYDSNAQLEETEALRQKGVEISSFIVAIIDQAKTLGLVKKTFDAHQFSFILWGMCAGMLNLIDTKNEMLKGYLPQSMETLYGSFAQIVIDGIRKK